MENNNFEQQFAQNLQATAAQAQPYTAAASSSSKLPLVVAIALAAVTLVESIVLIITLSNYFSIVKETNEEVSEEYSLGDDYDAEANYVYDEDYNLTAFEATCTNEDGSSFIFTKNNTFEELNSASSTVNSGTYSIINDDIIPLSSSSTNKVLYYNGFMVADGTKLYNCEENTTE